MNFLLFFLQSSHGISLDLPDLPVGLTGNTVYLLLYLFTVCCGFLDSIRLDFRLDIS